MGKFRDRVEYLAYIRHELRLVRTCIGTHSTLLADLQGLDEPLEKMIKTIDNTDRVPPQLPSKAFSGACEGNHTRASKICFAGM